MEYFELYKNIYRNIKGRFVDLNQLKEKYCQKSVTQDHAKIGDLEKATL